MHASLLRGLGIRLLGIRLLLPFGGGLIRLDLHISTLKSNFFFFGDKIIKPLVLVDKTDVRKNWKGYPINLLNNKVHIDIGQVMGLPNPPEWRIDEVLELKLTGRLCWLCCVDKAPITDIDFSSPFFISSEILDIVVSGASLMEFFGISAVAAMICGNIKY